MFVCCVHAFKLPLYGTRITIMATDAVLSGIWDEEWVGIGKRERGGVYIQ